MVGVADYFIKNLTKSSQFHASYFYSSSKSTLEELCKVWTEFGTEFHPSLLYFMSVKLQGQANSSQMVKQLFSINMYLFDYDPRDKNRFWEDSTKKRENWLVSPMQKPSEPLTLASPPLAVSLGENIPKVDQTGVHSMCKVKTLRFSK